MTVTEGENSYISLDDADSYFANRLYTDSWDDSSSDESEKELALIWATSLMENRVKWYGRKTDPSQTLQWPRKGLLDRYGNAVDSNSVPEIVKQVQCELAFSMMERNPMLIESGIEKMNLDGLTLNLQGSKQTIPWKIFSPLSVYGELLDGSATTRLSR